MRLTLVTNIPTAYRTPLYKQIRRLLRADGGELTVVYGASTESGRQWSDSRPSPGEVPSIVLSRGQLRVRGRTTYVNPAVAATVARTNPDVVVVTGFSPWIYAVSAWCKARGIPYLVWSGETVASAGRSRIRSLRRAPIMRTARGFLAYGPDASEYLVARGAHPSAVTAIGNGIDVDGFAGLVRLARTRAAAIKTELGVHGDVLLSVGDKGLEVVGAALPRLNCEDARVMVAGVESSTATPRGVVALGRLPSSKMPDLYAIATCLIHMPTCDRWPHAINEALSAGVPVVASPRCGIPDELCSGPGSTLVTRDPQLLARAIQGAMAVGRNPSESVREAVRAPLRRWAVPAMASRFVRATQRAACDR